MPVVEGDGRVAVAGDRAHLAAEPEPASSGRGDEPAVLVGRALAGRRGLRSGGLESKASPFDRGWLSFRTTRSVIH